MHSPAPDIMDISNWKILIVEDDLDVQEVMMTILFPHGASIMTALTGEEGLELLKHNPDTTIALIDLALPHMDGWQLLEAIRADPTLAGIPAVAITAYHSTNVAQEAIEAGFMAYFPKPINSRTFVQDLVGKMEN